MKQSLLVTGVAAAMIGILTTHDGLAPGTITMHGSTSGDVSVDFDDKGVAFVPEDVAFAALQTPGFEPATDEDKNALSDYQERLRNSPVQGYDAGPLVRLIIPDLAGCIEIVAGDNQTVRFDERGEAFCAEKTAETFFDSFPQGKKAWIESLEPPVAPDAPAEEEEEAFISTSRVALSSAASLPVHDEPGVVDETESDNLDEAEDDSEDDSDEDDEHPDDDLDEVEEPKVEEPKVEEPKVEEPKVEEPKAKAPRGRKPKATAAVDSEVSAVDSVPSAN